MKVDGCHMKLSRPTFQTKLCAAAWVVIFFAGCASPPNRAPVEDRGSAPRPTASSPTSPTLAETPAKPQPGAENAGKPGYYAVRPGDTLIRIGLDNGQNWRDIARWNNIENSNLIEVGQVLRIAPPGAEVAVATTRPVTAGGRVEVKPGAAAGTATASASPAAAAASASTTPTTPAAVVVAAAPPAREGDDDVNWAWPATGTVATAFEEGRSKGLAIIGKAGDPVLAAADGRVVYAGSGLRGYGNLIIVKHNATYLTAYAHNQVLLVKEDQAVRRGQRIAEMGSTDAERVQLHFEVRRQGKPLDPARVLPPR